MAPSSREFCKDVDGVVHGVNYDTGSDAVWSCCKEKFLWRDRLSMEATYRAHWLVTNSPGPVTCMNCIASEDE